MLSQSIKSKLPNILTSIRLFLVPLMVIFIYFGDDASRLVASIIFFIAGSTDLFDGYLARHWNVQSSFGTFLDPVADKLLVMIALIMLVEMRVLSGIAVVPALLIVGREVLVSGARDFVAENGANKINVALLSKWKTAMQFFAIGMLLTTGTVFDRLFHLSYMGMILLWLAAGLTLYTMHGYAVIFYRILFKSQSNHHL